MNRSYWKVVFRSIKGSLVRFLAILAIIALGVGFFSGLRVTMPSFMATGDKYIKEHELFDYRLISTIGFTKEDIEEISSVEGIRSCQGAVFKDALAVTMEPGSTEEPVGYAVVRFHSLTQNVNDLELEEGRLPQSPDEVVLDGYMCGPDVIGTNLVLKDDDGFSYKEFTVVGRVRSPYYLNFQRGTTDVGGGSIGYFAYIMEDSLDFEYYTEVFVKLDSDLESYSDEYEKNADEFEKVLKAKTEEVINNRFDDLIGEAKEDLEEGQKEFHDSLKDANDEIKDAEQELKDAREELDDAKVQIADAEVELADAKDTIDSSDEKLDEAKLTLEEYEIKISEAEETFAEKKEELDAANEELEKVRPLLPDLKMAKETLEAALPELETAKETLTEQKDGYALALEAQGDVEDPVYTQEGLEALVAALTEVETQYEEVKGQLEQVTTQITSIEEAEALYQSGLEAYNSAYEEFESQKSEYDDAKSKYNKGINDLNSGIKEYEDGVTELEDAKKEYEDGLQKYFDGVYELGRAKSELSMNAASTSQLLGHYQVKIDSFEEPEIYVLQRDTNLGYVCFENDAKIVDGMAEVFPMFFFAIAALVCSTTMQRMVADERVQIGTMRALGYTKAAIVMKYVIYSGLAAVIGCVGGFFGGSRLFPYVIWKVYDMMYGFAPITFRTDYLVLALSLAVSLICSVGVTIATCFGEFTEEPAELVRPKAPQSGKRILLERIGFIWKRLKFLHKVSARNVFRFKKRMWMMIIGIAGCTALVITGFGLKDSIDNLINFQYDEIMTYDLSVTFADDTTTKEMEEAFELAKDKTGAKASEVLLYETNVKHTSKAAIRDVTLFATSDESFIEYVRPHYEGTNYGIPSDGKVAISAKLASTNKLKPGDKITFDVGDEGETITAEIDYIFENYVYHYAIMNADTYESVFEEEYRPNGALYHVADDKGYEFGVAMSSNTDHVKAWSVTAESRRTFGETMKQLNYVVILVIGCAALLAFIVLFNLNNINITERVREIATLKVLGFNKLETGSYVFRENFILVFLGFLFGVPLGKLLHAFVISQIKMDIVTYKVIIMPFSYVLSLLTVLLFSITVDLVMRRKIDKIDMAESLKSIE